MQKMRTWFAMAGKRISVLAIGIYVFMYTGGRSS